MEEIYNIVNNELNETVEEAYKVLRANIQFCELDNKIKTLTITSCKPDEGKSTTAINLGISMAHTKLKVLYVDADLRKPTTFKYLMSSDSKGLTNYLMGQVTLEEIINNTNIDGFSFIACGFRPSNPGDLITSNRFGDFLQEVEKLYDIVIIDTPPLGSVIDAAIIATQTSGTIIVIEANTVRCKNALMIKEQLQKANANILGVVLNKINKTEYKYYNDSYNYYNSKNNYLKKWKFWKKK